MSSFLGYDPDGVDVLRGAMRRVVDDLRAIRCDDPASADARTTIASTVSAISERWLPLLDDLAMCRWLDAYVEQALAPDDLTMSTMAMLHERYGWRVVSDPLVMPSTVRHTSLTEHAARAIAWRLTSTEDVGELLNGDAVAWLSRALEQIAADPALTAAFVSEMTPEAWGALADELARQELWALDPINIPILTPDDHVLTGDLHRAFAALGDIVAADDLAVLDEMGRYSAALIVANLDLAGEELADVTERLLRRWLDGRDPEWADMQHEGPNASDVLIPLLLDDDVAMSAYLAHTTADPALLFIATADPRRAESLALAMTRPGAAPDVEIGGAVVAWSRYVLDGGYVAEWMNDPYGIHDAHADYHSMLGELAAPWLLQFTDWRRHEWGFAEGEGEALLGRILHDDAAFDRFGDARGAAIEAFDAAVAASPDSAVDDLGAVSGLLDRIAYDRSMDDARQAGALWDLKVGIASAGLTYVVAWAGARVSPAVGKGARQIARRVSEPLLERIARAHGWDWVPPTEAESEDDAAAALSWSHTLLVAAVATTSFEQLVSSGRLPPNPPGPPAPVAGQSTLDYRHALDEWRAGLPDDVQEDAGLYRDLITTYDPERPDS